MPYDVFISYRRSDLSRAELLHRLLKERGVDAWYDALLAAGDDWRSRTARTLVEAPVFVLLFSKDAAQSEEIVKELSAATLHRKTVIPVRLENLPPEGAFLYELASRNWFDAFDKTDARLEVLADQLAALVTRGPNSIAPVAAKSKRRWGFGVGVAALAVLAAVVAFKLSQPTRDPSADLARVAFFGFTATTEDPAARNIAAIATDESFTNLAVRHVNMLARGDTTGSEEASRLTRARELGASFALSGEVRRDGDLARFTMRLEDVRDRRTLWESTVAGPVDTPVPTAFSAADKVVELTDCVSTAAYTGEAGLRDAASLPLIGAACGAATTRGSHARLVGLLREMKQRNLGGPDINAVFAYLATYGIETASPAQRRSLLAEAQESLALAVKFQPDSYATAIALFGVGTLMNQPPLEWIPQFERILQRAPGPREAHWYALANRRAGATLISAGRIRDGAGYLKAASDADPLTNANTTAYAVALAASGQIDTGQAMSWDARIEEIMRNRPDGWTWEFGLAASIFSGRGDTERLFALAPATVPPQTVDCYRALHAALKLAGATARLAAAKKAEACLTEYDSPHMIVQAASLLGDLDAAYAKIDTPDEAYLLTRYYYAPWFLPSTRAMRADARFLPLMERLGYVDYWRQSGTRPDVCASEQEKGIPLCVALRAPPATSAPRQ